MGKRNIGTSFIWKANRIKDLPTVVLHRHRKHPIKDHSQRYHVNIGKRYMKGNVNPRSSEIHFKKGNKNVIVKGVDKPKMKKTVYLTNGKDVAVVKAMSSDGKKLKVHIIGKEGYEYVDPKDWRVLKVVSGNLFKRKQDVFIGKNITEPFYKEKRLIGAVPIGEPIYKKWAGLYQDMATGKYFIRTSQELDGWTFGGSVGIFTLSSVNDREALSDFRYFVDNYNITDSNVEAWAFDEPNSFDSRRVWMKFKKRIEDERNIKEIPLSQREQKLWETNYEPIRAVVTNEK